MTKSQFTVHFWGVRGSIPTPGQSTISMKNPRSLCLSASSLDVFTKCPRLFAYRYLAADKLYFPFTNNGRPGTQFHRLVEVLTPLPETERQIWLDRLTEPRIKTWWQTFCRAGLDQVKDRFYSEFSLQVDYQGWQLQSRYDRLVVRPENYQVWDWKTGKKNKTWQTKLYPLLLHWGLGIKPEQISVHFWYVNSGEDSFCYSSTQQHQDQKDLTETLTQIDRLDFPPTTETKTCQECFFRYHCWGEQIP